MSKEIVRGEKTPDEIRIKKAEWYEQQSVNLRTGVTVASIDTDAHVVRLADGEEVAYDQLLLATGGRARHPWSAPGIRTLRSLADAPHLQAELPPGQPPDRRRGRPDRLRDRRERPQHRAAR